MRPLKLTFRGLNSFEKEQIIDFKKLTSAGLFGIFGPTGSGKSTIIDACTMALYSDMSRQSGRECISAGCSEMYVCLEFEIQNEIYIVERAYTCDKKALKQKRARLYKASDGVKQIISDKPREITVCVSELIGLNYSDFSRSVILPQGKFSEFLMLGERDRSDMLERIFGLEEYGDRFMKRLKAVKREQENSLALVENSLLSFEGVSLESLKIAETDLSLDAERIVEYKNMLSDTVKALDKKRKLLGYVNEYEGYKRGLAERLGVGSEIDHKRELLARAEKAAVIKPYIEAASKTEAQISQHKHNLERIGSDLASAEKKLLTVRALTEELAAQKDEQLPRLIELEARINQAMVIESDLNFAKREREKLLGEYKSYNNVKKECESDYEKKSVQIEEIKKDLNALISRRAEIAVQPERRQEIIAAYGLISDLKKLGDRSAALERKQRRLDAEAEGSVKEIEIVTRKTGVLSMEKQILTQKTEDMKLHKPEAKEVFELKKALRHNEPCPVCGSTHHPSANNMTEGDITKWEKEFKGIEKRLSECMEEIVAQGIKKAALGGRLESYEAQKSELARESEGLKQEASELDNVLAEYRQRFGKEDIVSLYDGMLKADNENSVLSEREAGLRKQSELLATDMERLRSSIAVHQGELDKIIVLGNEKGEQIQKMSSQLCNMIGGRNAAEYLNETKLAIAALTKKAGDSKAELLSVTERHDKCKTDHENVRTELAVLEEIHITERGRIFELLSEHKMEDYAAVNSSWIPKPRMDSLKNEIRDHDGLVKELRDNIVRLEGLIGEGYENDSTMIKSEVKALEERQKTLSNEIEQKTGVVAVIKKRIENMREDLVKKNEFQKHKKKIEHRLDLINDLDSLFRGNEFVKYISKQHLRYITHEASRRMKEMTGGRYAIELDNTDFIIRDDFNGGSRRSPRTLSGGETFMVSLCLALALSTKLQLKNRTALEFFFLDEGFGTLDSKILDTVMDCLERLRSEKMSVGIISHVEELKSRIPIKLNVHYDADKGGSRVEV